jgi:hypothetical protein
MNAIESGQYAPANIAPSLCDYFVTTTSRPDALGVFPDSVRHVFVSNLQGARMRADISDME